MFGMSTSHWLPMTLRRSICTLLLTGMVVHAKEATEETQEDLFFKSCYGVKKNYERAVQVESHHPIFFGRAEMDDTLWMLKAAEKLCEALEKERDPKRPKDVKAWFEKLTDNDCAYLKEIIFAPRTFPFNLTGHASEDIKDQLLLRMFVFRLIKRIIEQEEWHQRPAVWQHREKVGFKRVGRSIMDYHFPEAKSWLGRMDEDHTLLDPASDEMVRRLKEQKLYIDNESKYQNNSRPS